MTANDLMMFLVDLHMQGNNLEEIEVSFRSHGGRITARQWCAYGDYAMCIRA